jgi:hypothetical protein
MTDDWVEVEQDWAISLYSKVGREFSEIGVFFEGALVPEEAFELFSQVVSAVPSWQATDHAVSSGIENIEYEVRLWSETKKRCFASFLWSADAVKEAISNLSPRTSHSVLINVELFEDEESSDPENWDWEELIGTQRLTVLTITPPLDNLEPESTEGDANDS